MFIDSARITVQGGDGGRGCVSFRREKYSSRGGPDGGDGGDGGDVRLLASSSASTLLVFRNKNQIAARSGTPGRRQDQHGRKGPDTRFKVPVGTLVIDVASDEILFDLAAEGDEVVVARGGRGGSGNARFKSSTQRAPRRAGEGAPGENRLLRLELRLLADVGIVGAPNAGKSSLLARISNSTPRIADYPFSTLEPVLGVVDLGDYKSCVAADVPGLIKGAHVGKGLGSHFLRHIQRTRVLVHVVDLFPPEGDPMKNYGAVMAELGLFDESLLEKPVIVAANKIDLPEARHAMSNFGQPITAEEVIAISAVTGEGLSDLLRAVRRILSNKPLTDSQIKGNGWDGLDTHDTQAVR